MNRRKQISPVSVIVAALLMMGLPVHAGPYSNGPYSNGPYSNGPYSNGPYSNGPYSNGPYSNGPYSNGPYSNGSQTGISWIHQNPLIATYSAQLFDSDMRQVTFDSSTKAGLKSWLLTGVQAENGHYTASDADIAKAAIFIFGYLYGMAAGPTESLTMSYYYGGTTYTKTLYGGLGLCTEWTAGTAAASDVCRAYLSAGLMAVNQPAGKRNLISIRQPAYSYRYPNDMSSTYFNTPTSTAGLGAVSLVQPLAYKHNVALNPSAPTAQRVVSSWNDASTSWGGNANAGWKGVYVFQCRGGNSVTVTTCGLSSPVADTVLRVCKGVNTCDSTDTDMRANYRVGENDDSACGTKSTVTFTCGDGYGLQDPNDGNNNQFYEPASTYRTSFRYTYNFMVRNYYADTIANAETQLAAPLRTNWSALGNPAPAGETAVLDEFEGTFMGQLFPKDSSGYIVPRMLSSSYQCRPYMAQRGVPRFCANASGGGYHSCTTAEKESLAQTWPWSVTTSTMIVPDTTQATKWCKDNGAVLGDGAACNVCPGIASSSLPWAVVDAPSIDNVRGNPSTRTYTNNFTFNTRVCAGIGRPGVCYDDHWTTGMYDWMDGNQCYAFNYFGSMAVCGNAQHTTGIFLEVYNASNVQWW